jgi:esterase/lipase superfamily enzyme
MPSIRFASTICNSVVAVFLVVGSALPQNQQPLTPKNPTTDNSKFFGSGHTGKIIGMKISPGERYTLSLDAEKTLVLWDAIKRKSRVLYIDHLIPLEFMEFSSDGEYLAAFHVKSIYLWDLSSGTLKSKFLDDNIHCVAVSVFGKEVAIAYSKHLVLWERGSDRTAHLSSGKGSPKKLRFSPDGRFLAVIEGDYSVTLWNVLNEEKVISFEELIQEKVPVFAFSDDSRYFAWYGKEKELYLWNLESEQRLQSVKLELPGVESLRFLPGDDGLILGGLEGQLAVIDFKRGIDLGRFDPSSNSRIELLKPSTSPRELFGKPFALDFPEFGPLSLPPLKPGVSSAPPKDDKSSPGGSVRVPAKATNELLLDKIQLGLVRDEGDHYLYKVFYGTCRREKEGGEWFPYFLNFGSTDDGLRFLLTLLVLGIALCCAMYAYHYALLNLKWPAGENAPEKLRAHLSCFWPTYVLVITSLTIFVLIGIFLPWSECLLSLVFLIFCFSIYLGLRHLRVSRKWLQGWLPICLVNFGVFLLYFLIIGAINAWDEVARDHEPGDTYGSSVDNQLNVGYCLVSVPKNRPVGSLDRQREVFGFPVESPNEAEHFLAKGTYPYKKSDQMYEDLRTLFDQSKDDEAIVFVHGFRVTFEEAALRTAQIAHDLDFQGIPIFYSWPAKGELLGYLSDANAVDSSVLHLEKFLLDLANKSHAKKIHIVAHSMGARVVTLALKGMHAKMALNNMPLKNSVFREIVLAAPDIDAHYFRQFAEEFANELPRITLYASSNDQALQASKTIHGGGPRAGDSAPASLMLVSGVDTIDASLVDTSLDLHGYFASNATVQNDLIQLLKLGKNPEQRGLERKEFEHLPYWIIDPRRKEK